MRYNSTYILLILLACYYTYVYGCINKMRACNFIDKEYSKIQMNGGLYKNGSESLYTFSKSLHCEKYQCTCVVCVPY